MNKFLFGLLCVVVMSLLAAGCGSRTQKTTQPSLDDNAASLQRPIQ